MECLLSVMEGLKKKFNFEKNNEYDDRDTTYSVFGIHEARGLDRCELQASECAFKAEHKSGIRREYHKGSLREAGNQPELLPAYL